MSYRIDVRQAALKQLLGLSNEDYQRISQAVDTLTENPRPSNAKKLSGSTLYRIRIQRFRVVYDIDDGTKAVTIVRVARRSEQTYRNL